MQSLAGVECLFSYRALLASPKPLYHSHLAPPLKLGSLSSSTEEPQVFLLGTGRHCPKPPVDTLPQSYLLRVLQRTIYWPWITRLCSLIPPDVPSNILNSSPSLYSWLSCTPAFSYQFKSINKAPWAQNSFCGIVSNIAWWPVYSRPCVLLWWPAVGPYPPFVRTPRTDQTFQGDPKSLENSPEVQEMTSWVWDITIGPKTMR
jgi:hypothetical protein